VTEILPIVLRECAEDYEEMCAFLGETFEKESFWAGYLAYGTWREEHARPLVIGQQFVEIGNGIALPLAS